MFENVFCYTLRGYFFQIAKTTDKRTDINIIRHQYIVQLLLLLNLLIVYI